VDIVTPTDTHFGLCKICIEAKKAVFVEKPLTLTLDEARELVNLVQSKGAILQVGHIFRFHPVTSALREVLIREELGRFRYIYGHFMGFKRPRTDVGVTLTDSIHYFHLLNYLVPEGPRAVTAVLHDLLGRGMDDLSLVTIEYDNLVAHIESGDWPPGKWRDFTIVGEYGAAAADFNSSQIQVYRNHHEVRDGQWVASVNGNEIIHAEGPEPLYAELQSFLRAVEFGDQVAVTVEDGYRAMFLACAAQRSAREKRMLLLSNEL
jgi:predicted dehydrogenase